MKEDGWSKEFPTEPGMYWFYGYQYGKISCGSECLPKLLLANVFKGGNRIMIVVGGAFMYESETECAHFKRADLPNLPTI